MWRDLNAKFKNFQSCSCNNGAPSALIIILEDDSPSRGTAHLDLSPEVRERRIIRLGSAGEKKKYFARLSRSRDESSGAKPRKSCFGLPRKNTGVTLDVFPAGTPGVLRGTLFAMGIAFVSRRLSKIDDGPAAKCQFIFIARARAHGGA